MAELDAYLARTPGSARLHREGRAVLPGGDTRTTIHHEPYPLYLAEGAGAVVTDVDDNEYTDFTNNHTALVHGNAFPPVVAAVSDQLGRGACFGTPTPLQVQAAELLTTRVPSLDLVRFCASGTEATMQATRAARAHTERQVIAKFEGAYHGSQDDALVSTHPSADEAGPSDRPLSTPRCAGLGSAALTDTLVLPFNQPEAAVILIREHRADLAAVLVEPVMGSAGMIAAERDYLHAVRTAAAEVGALFMVDEVITFRLAPAGGQEWFGLDPDLSCYGKMLGGGLPLGAFGGRAEVMSRYDPTRADVLAHPGSMNGNAAALASSIATLDALTAERIATMNGLGDDLRRRLTAVIETHAAAMTVTGAGSLIGLHYTSGPVRSFRDTWVEDRDLGHEVFLGLLNEGVLIDRRGAACLSTVSGPEHLERFERALDSILGRIPF